MALLVSHCSDDVPKHSAGPLKYVFCDEGFSADREIYLNVVFFGAESEPLRELRYLFTLVQPVEPQCRSKSPAFKVLLTVKVSASKYT